jgi:hypothetical protein
MHSKLTLDLIESSFLDVSPSSVKGHAILLSMGLAQLFEANPARIERIRSNFCRGTHFCKGGRSIVSTNMYKKWPQEDKNI